jgi:hypothetical protein
MGIKYSITSFQKQSSFIAEGPSYVFKALASSFSYALENTTFSVNIIVTLIIDLMTLKSIGVMYWTWLLIL